MLVPVCAVSDVRNINIVNVLFNAIEKKSDLCAHDVLHIPSFSQHIIAVLQVSTLENTVGEGQLTDKEPNEQRCKTNKEKKPHNNSDQDARLLFGWLLLSAG